MTETFLWNSEDISGTMKVIMTSENERLVIVAVWDMRTVMQ